MSNKAVVIVDGYSSGALLAPELKKRGFGESQKEGARLPTTTDLFSSPGIIMLLHKNSNQIRKDSRAVDELTKKYFLEK